MRTLASRHDRDPSRTEAAERASIRARRELVSQQLTSRIVQCLVPEVCATL